MLIGARSSRVGCSECDEMWRARRSRRINDQTAAMGLSHVQICYGLFWMLQAVLAGQIGRIEIGN
ncbi:hypothetical protein BO83DRAFT_379327 [Aspergillus eucalypticola CBS 122712]|uniref:Uncharacterized protein n=1 Tax=Aspergillus eucalypticola (strain CBS 122712 / IBT 29274) TaxID=1448314 RepID=A0A317VBW9_ASPEC|nr:uncharacterized protein BO83DRAFT_379327 [Aspergillus eucalypticola CBS 122712]PWY70567.1 hypothetical protein BO83DRAFT_379327 [Aspergillus eucalypticola CBS 122712]